MRLMIIKCLWEIVWREKKWRRRECDSQSFIEIDLLVADSIHAIMKYLLIICCLINLEHNSIITAYF